MDSFDSVAEIYPELRDYVLDMGEKTDVGEWHAMKVQGNPMLISYECRNVVWQAAIPHTVASLQREFKGVNLPWAEKQFQERVSGQPLNPPPSFKEWPWQGEMDRHRHCRRCGQAAIAHEGSDIQCEGFEEMPFSHSYPERYWGRWEGPGVFRRGIRFRYGDISDLIAMLLQRPFTRQAYLPMFWPEDTAAAYLGERVPCSLGWHFLLRDGEEGRQLHLTYFIRSCDLRRHLCDDVYMSMRLVHWALEKLGEQDSEWAAAVPGIFTFHCSSLHLFEGDRKALQRERRIEAGVPS